jgi:uncharacterized membrane protein
MATATHPDDASDAALQPQQQQQPRWHGWFRYTLPGAWVALLFACVSFTPSLLPRGAVVQGVVCGITGAIGYGLGVWGASIWRAFANRGPREPRRGAWRAFAITAVVGLVASFALGQRWQAQIRDLMDVPDPNPIGFLLLPVAAALVFVGLIAAGRLLRKAYHWTSAQLGRWIGPRAAQTLGWLIVVALVVVLVNDVLLKSLVSLADSAFSVRNDITKPGAVQPSSELRSGGPGSLVSWESLGREGRSFTGTGPTAIDIAAFTGAPAMEPIRAYAGMETSEDVERRADMAVDDLERAGGFQRAYLLVVTTTGSGWVDPAAADTFEYLTGGNSAIVGMQYSYLPSWISYLVDQARAREAGRELYDAVYDRWSRLPADARPQLLVAGESLGSFGGETAFSGEHDMRNRTSGVLFAGPPNFNTLFREFTDDRDPGTPEVEPVYRGGRTVRFSNATEEGIPPEATPWQGSRVLYLQHPSDPIVWWSPRLALQEPDWLDEKPGHDVLDEMVWLPFVTFWQITADLPLAAGVPSGHGHVYSEEYVDGWATILHPPDWTADKTAQLKQTITRGP